MSPAREIISALLDKHPQLGVKTIARIAYKQNPRVWISLEAAYTAVRRAAGVRRDRPNMITHPRPQGKPGDAFGKLPEGQTYFDEWQAVQFDGPMKALVLSDIHLPYHDKPSLLLALKWGKANGVDTVLLNGDTCDFFSVSFWEKDPRKRNFKAELDTARQFFAALREAFPKARIIFKQGNHEERFDRYMMVKAPELFGVDEFDSDKLLHLDKHGIEPSIGDKRPIRLGTLNVIHGHEYRMGAIANPVNPARGLFLRTKAHAICGHFHQSSYHTETTVEEDSIACWSTGCLCDLHPDYMPLNKWNHGFAYVEVFNDNKFEVKNMVIIKGKIY